MLNWDSTAQHPHVVISFHSAAHDANVKVSKYTATTYSPHQLIMSDPSNQLKAQITAIILMQAHVANCAAFSILDCVIH